MNKIKKIMLLMILIFPLPVFASVKENLDSLNAKIDNLNNNLFLNSHPVGSIYMTTNVDENTVDKIQTKYGGTWKVYAEGKIIMGYNSNDSKFNKVEQTGGSYSTTLSIDNLPSHNHNVLHSHTTPAITISSSGEHTHTTETKTVSFALTLNSNGNHTHSFSNGGSVFVVNSTSTHSGMPYNIGFVSTDSTGSWWIGAHKSNSTIANDGVHNHTVSGSITIPSHSINSSGEHTHTVQAMNTSGSNVSTTGSTGSGVAFSNLAPYVVVYTYKRVS